MKVAKILAVAALFLTATTAVNAFPLIAQWGFEIVTPPDATDAAANGPHLADGGANAATSEASGLHASAQTDWTTPAGNGSVNSYSSTNWAIGDYYQFCTSTIGFSGITLNWDQTSSNTGPRDFVVQYNVNGGAYTNAGAHTVLANSPAWSSGTFQGIYHQYEDLTAVTALNNQNQICLRLTVTSNVSANGGAVAAAGTDRVDNFTIPEPATLSMLAIAGLALIRRRR